MKILKILETVKNFIKKNKKLVTVVSAMFCAVVLVAGSIAGTIAYLTDTKTVTNTFTVGNVKITLDEAVVGNDGKAVNASTNRTNATQSYKLIPGKEYDKDPTIHVDANSEACWLFVKVENNLSSVEIDNGSNKTIHKQLLGNGWTLLEGNIYWHAVANAGANVNTFKTFTVNQDANATDLEDVDGKSIVVTAYAVQSNGFDTAADAWAETKSGFGF